MRPDIVLLHGFTHTGASWDPVIRELGQSYRALAPDLPGHGPAGAAGAVSWDAAVERALDPAGGRRALAGYSMGARVALAAAVRSPERVRRLFLVGGTAGIADAVERDARRADDERLADEIEADTIERFARRWAAQPVLRGQPRSVAEAAHADRLRNRPEGLAAALRALGVGAMAPLWERLPGLALPLTLIVGERDAKFRKVGERMAGLARDAELVVVPACGHAVHLEAPALVAACIRERLPATPS